MLPSLPTWLAPELGPQDPHVWKERTNFRKSSVGTMRKMCGSCHREWKRQRTRATGDDRWVLGKASVPCLLVHWKGEHRVLGWEYRVGLRPDRSL